MRALSGEVARREKRGRPLLSRAFSHARGHLLVSGVLLDGPRKERLLVVYTCTVGCVLFIINFEHYFLQGSLVLNKTLMKKYCKLASLLSVLVLVTECKVCN